jgi:WD40 repeat protein
VVEEENTAAEKVEAPVGRDDDKQQEAGDEEGPENKIEAPAELENDPLPDGAIARLGTPRFRAGRYINRTAFSPDGKMLAAVSYGYNHVIHLFDATTGRELRRFWALAESLAFTPDGRSIACAGWPGQVVQLWDAASGELMRQFDAPESKVCSIALSMDGRTLASGDEGMTNQTVLYVWDIATGQRLGRFEAMHNYLVHVAMSPDGKLLASWGYHLHHLPRGTTLPEGEGSRTIQLWHVATGEELRRLQVEHGQEVGRVTFSPDGKSLAALSTPGGKNRGREKEEKAIHVWSVPSGKEQSRIGVSSRTDFPEFAYSPDGKVLAAGVEEKKLYMWDPATGKPLGPFPKPDYYLSSLVFLPDDKMLACGVEATTAIRLWDVRTGKISSAGRGGHTSPVTNIVYSPRQKVLISADHDGAARQWDAVTRKELRPLLDRHGSFWSHYVLSPEGAYLAHVGRYGFAQLWEVATGKRLFDANDSLFEHLDEGKQPRSRGYFYNCSASNVVFSPNGKLMAAGSRKSVLLCETETGRELPPLENSEGEFRSVAFSPDGKLLASVKEAEATKPKQGAHQVYVWDMDTGKERCHFSVDVQRYPQLTFSPDDRLLAVTGWWSTIGFWEIATGRKVGVVEGQWNHVACQTFSPDGKMLAFADQKDGLDEYPLYLAEAATGQIRRRFTGHRGHVLVLAFLPDGEALASGSMDTTVLLWDIIGWNAKPRARKSDLSTEELEKCMSDLSSMNGAAAFTAIRTLVAAPRQAVPLLTARVRPAPSADQRKVAQWIADLESDQFPERKRAAAELEDLAEAAEPAIRQALEKEHSTELGRHAERLLSQLARWSPKRLRVLRSIEVLEHIGNAESCNALKGLAQGAPESRLTREAKAALERLEKRDRRQSP